MTFAFFRSQSPAARARIWAALPGYAVFDAHPSASTLTGGLIICGATVWIARREPRR